MIINHPLLGPRDSAEFTYMGDAKLIDRPDWQAPEALSCEKATWWMALRAVGLLLSVL